jgi:catechol 2,3-dioxygenase-like lactoylglutathione lyase family enzyme
MLGNSPVIALLPCVNLDSAREFYGGVLGLKEGAVPGSEESAEQGALYDCGGGTKLVLYQRATPTTADHTAAGWIVDDVDAVADALIAKGVKLEVYDLPGMEFDDRGVVSMSIGKGAWFKDPEGNILSISDFM